jgi:general secretion pathway protein A
MAGIQGELLNPHPLPLWGCAQRDWGREFLNSSGFVLLDSQFRPVYADPESIRILGFPNAISNPELLDGILAQKIMSILPSDFALHREGFIAQYQSGKRLYLCRAFILEDHWNGNREDKRIALLLERGLPSAPTSMAKQKRLVGMYEDPFCFSPDPKYYNFSRAHMEVFATLRGLVREGRGIGVLAAQAGVGKTILLGFLAATLREESEIAILSNSFDNRTEFVRAVMAALGVGRASGNLAENLKKLEQWLVGKNLSGRRVTLFCDDAQDFSMDALDNICMLSDLKIGQKPLIQVILAGRQGLLEKLNSQRLEAANIKINVFCRLGPLDEAEVRNYVLHRLKVAGCTRQLFSQTALASIALYSRGIPLNINMICRHSISLAAAIGLQLIDDKIIADSAYDLVLRAQPSSIWEEPGGISVLDSRTGTGLLRDRRGLRLVKKPQS